MPTHSVLALALVFASACSLALAQPPSKGAAKDGAKKDGANADTAKKDDAGKSDGKKKGDPKADDATKGDSAGKGKDSGEDKPDKTPEAVVKFDAQMAEWKKVLGELRVLMEKYKTAKQDDKPALETEFDDLLKKGQALEPELIDLGLAAVKALPVKDADHYKLVLHQTKAKFTDKDYKEAMRIAGRIISGGIETPQLRKWAGVSAFHTDDYATAVAHLAKTGKEGKPHEDVKRMHDEAVIRVAEAKEDNLPRVTLHTTKGDVLIELFENEAPNTVANFISLVEEGFYNGLKFYNVIPRYGAETGDPKNLGNSGPPYTIECECYEKNHRKHFRGTVTMELLGRRDTGGSRFAVLFHEAEPYDGKQTVFGRVLEGMDVIDKLEVTVGGGKPDKILTAEVIRRRKGSTYKPKKIDKKG